MSALSLKNHVNNAEYSLSKSNYFQASKTITQYQLYSTNTGWKQSNENYRESSERRALLVRENERIASELEKHGIETRLANNSITAIGEVTGATDTVESFRSICFLPLIAQRERKPILNGLQYFQRHNKLGPYLRLAVVTTGERIPLFGDLRGTMQKMHRDISRWAHEADKEWNVAVIYRGSEFTYDSDTRSFHPHANVLYTPRKALKGHRWSEFLAWTHKRLGAHWQDSGKLKKPQEAIKYPFKPLELQSLDSLALVWLYMQTRRLKIAQPMRDFKDWRETLEYDVTLQDRVNPLTGEVVTKRIKVKRERPLKIGMVNTPEGAQLSLIEKACGHKTGDSTPALTEEDIQKWREEKEQEGWSEDLIDALCPSVGHQGDCTSQENMILCRTAPSFRFSPYAEPVTLVQDYTEHPVTPEGKERLAEIKARQKEALRYWEANGAPDPRIALNTGKAIKAAAEGKARNVRPFNVHTSRSTVQNNKQRNFSFSEPTSSRTGAPPARARHTPRPSTNPVKSTTYGNQQ